MTPTHNLHYLSERDKDLSEINAIIAAELQEIGALLLKDEPLNFDWLLQWAKIRDSKIRSLPKDIECKFCQKLFHPENQEHVIITTQRIDHSDGTIIQHGNPARLPICASCWGKMGI